MEEKVPRILIIDDERNNLLILTKILKSEYETITATNGIDGLEMATGEQPPDLIILDVMMPEIDGYEVCRKLKNHEKTKDVPVIFITARGGHVNETRGLDVGAVDYVTKPFHPQSISARVKTHLKLKHKTDLLENMVSLDGLTEIPNRRRFNEVFDSEWRRSVRTKTSIALLMIDIDFFKQFNDHYGHAIGDDCLKKVAQAIQRSIHRPTDLVARYGGEEFAVILPETDLKGALHVAEMMQENIKALNIFHEKSSAHSLLTVSIGVTAMSPTINSSQDIFFKTADEMLYKAKDSGRNAISHCGL